MHFTNRRFWQYYNALPKAVQLTADQCYGLLKADPSHPSLHFKKVSKYWSVRVGQNYRALGIEVERGILWFWIGTHAEYNQRLKK